MAKAAPPFSNVFVAAGLPTDFIARLEAAASALLGSLSDRAQSRGKRSGPTKGLKSRLAGGRKIVHILDAFVKSALKDDPALLANWNSVKRVRRCTSRAAVATAATPPSVTPTAPTPSVHPAPTAGTAMS